MTTVQEKNSTERRSAKYPREDKQAIVAEIKEYIETSKATLFTEYRGLSVSQLAELRAELRAEGSEYKVYKNVNFNLVGGNKILSTSAFSDIFFAKYDKNLQLLHRSSRRYSS